MQKNVLDKKQLKFETIRLTIGGKKYVWAKKNWSTGGLEIKKQTTQKRWIDEEDKLTKLVKGKTKATKKAGRKNSSRVN